MDLEHSLSQAIDFLYQNQLPSGEFRTYLSLDKQMQHNVGSDSCNFVTGVFLYSTRFVEHPKIAEMMDKARYFLIEEMEGAGFWRYWTRASSKMIAQDLDDTSLISFTLQDHDPLIRSGHNKKKIIDNRNPNGLFYTWIKVDNMQNDVDSVINANVLLYLGDIPETKAASDYLNTLVLTASETSSYWYYLNDMALYYAMSRAYFHGVESLKPSTGIMLDKVLSFRQKDGALGDELTTALGICTSLNLGLGDVALLKTMVESLLHRQQPGGYWARIPFYTGPEPPIPHSAWFGSEELTTSICVEALTRFQKYSDPNITFDQK